jgi:2-(1,2-epoxy-1,2-dihydrophenyl)acetyl-CoA isomerase
MAESYRQAVEEARAAAREGDLVLVEREGAHAIVTLNDSDKLNPLSAPLTVGLRDALNELAGDESLRAIVLTGADPAFCAGGDLRLMRDTAQPMLAGGGGAPELWRWIRMSSAGGTPAVDLGTRGWMPRGGLPEASHGSSPAPTRRSSPR